ncbi:MAG TPA: hypothetical protein PLE50_07320 [Rhabdaerophilum sp.]|nr:hypothetical protein [Rhabdaerophilum sp.]
MESLIIQLISGAIGGNVAGKVMPKFDLGTLWNSVAGIVGGGLGAQIIGAIVPGLLSGGLNVSGIVSSIAAGGAGGGVLLALVGVVRSMMQK